MKKRLLGCGAVLLFFVAATSPIWVGYLFGDTALMVLIAIFAVGSGTLAAIGIYRSVADDWLIPADDSAVLPTCLDIARAAIAEVQQWQPIETAPKDGTRILLARLEWCEPGRWLPDYQVRDNLPPGGWMDDYDSGSSEGHDWPTHWMPLPEPPVD